MERTGNTRQAECETCHKVRQCFIVSSNGRIVSAATMCLDGCWKALSQ